MRFFNIEMADITAKRKEVTYVVGDLAEVIVRPNNLYAASATTYDSYEDRRAAR